jgi:hypothetical protein
MLSSTTQGKPAEYAHVFHNREEILRENQRRGSQALVSRVTGKWAA